MRLGRFRLWEIAVLLAGLLLISQSLAGEKSRESVLAGSWYPENPLQLAKVVDGFLDDPSDAQSKVKNPLRALIVPHAGYMYSWCEAWITNGFCCWRPATTAPSKDSLLQM
ncbi:MAG: AmmeMemoRadiSam system protein B [endosymbiont of Seepiophila jonesi]|uniref:AmmeMemoRadiSam system protein B n=1 Tax=endosymbiont of Lamellibrachia luymesi TaxID=2200907 RepID=A0A370DUR2_9GAMM|nr:MAG: AmmeMemoRadiSam system protein B [endosymbiont of Lamellibrachia luymesi]RDH94141.1 MAG: AmmeMemoRadiSam system protein B [endosymbiont of Seepiophila jonesi]